MTPLIDPLSKLWIHFPFFPALIQTFSFSVDSQEFELVDHAKVSGVTIASTLQWNYHIHEVIKKSYSAHVFSHFVEARTGSD